MQHRSTAGPQKANTHPECSARAGPGARLTNTGPRRRPIQTRGSRRIANRGTKTRTARSGDGRRNRREDPSLPFPASSKTRRLIRSPSRQWQQTVPAQRSGNASACGARNGVRMLSTPSLRKTSSKARLEFTVAVADQEPGLGNPVSSACGTPRCYARLQLGAWFTRRAHRGARRA